MTEVYWKLRRLAEQIEDIKLEASDLEDDFNPEAELFHLLSISALETAHRLMRLAYFKEKPEDFE
jgi:hypothetical protein